MKRNLQIVACLMLGGLICCSGFMVWIGSPINMAGDGSGMKGSNTIFSFLFSTQSWLVNTFGVFLGGLGMVIIGVLTSLFFLRFLGNEA